MREIANCGVCGEEKVRRRTRLVCLRCSRRHASEARLRNGTEPYTPARRETKRRHRNKVRPSGLTNQQVYSLKKRYGLTEDDFLALLEKQDHRCGVCSKPFNDDPVVDHNHETGVVRGLLCRTCNLALGLLREDVEILSAAIAWLVAA